MRRFLHFALILCLVNLISGCMGIRLLNPLRGKPYTMFAEDEPFGRDQIVNRSLVASDLMKIKGWHANTVMTALGQPQKIQVTEKQTASEDWYFLYYRGYHEIPDTAEGTLVIRIYNNKVIDVIKLS